MLTHAHLTFRISILADQITCLQCTGHQNASACENTSGQELKQYTTHAEEVISELKVLPKGPPLRAQSYDISPR